MVTLEPGQKIEKFDDFVFEMDPELGHCPSGYEFWFHLTGFIVLDENGKIILDNRLKIRRNCGCGCS